MNGHPSADKSKTITMTTVGAAYMNNVSGAQTCSSSPDDAKSSTNRHRAEGQRKLQELDQLVVYEIVREGGISWDNRQSLTGKNETEGIYKNINIPQRAK